LAGGDVVVKEHGGKEGAGEGKGPVVTLGRIRSTYSVDKINTNHVCHREKNENEELELVKEQALHMLEIAEELLE
jgi:hypothetical protein